MYELPLPPARPAGLARRSLAEGTTWWRVDGTPPSAWRWDGFDDPRHRFDPASGAFRTRYAARSVAGAFRERYLSVGRVVPADHADHHLVRLTLTRPASVLDLRTKANRDALRVDDRVSVGRERTVWTYCNALPDAIRAWWSDDVLGIAYRSRTTPETSVNLAFFGDAAFAVDARPLTHDDDVLADLVRDHGFTIAFL